MRQTKQSFLHRLHLLVTNIGRRRRNRPSSKPGPRVPRWLGRKMGQEGSSIIDDSVPPHTLSARTLTAVAEYIKSGRAKRIAVLTGAGISTAAGIPDFRSPDTGLYSNLSRLKLPYAEAVFDISYFREHPKPFYVLANELYPGKFYPTVSHAFIALLAQKGLLQMLFTQNIDCLERRAGVPADKIIEAHGSFATQRCIDCKTEYPDDKMKEHIFKGEVPRCEEKNCDGLVKPDIVFFGESLPKSFDHNAYQVELADLVLILGTSLTVYPFAGLPDLAAPGRPRVLFNMEQVGNLGSRTDDVIELGACDEGIRKLADQLGWSDELEKLWRGVVGDKEADRQNSTSKTHLNEEAEDEVQKLTKEIESALKLDDDDDEERHKVKRIAKLMDSAIGPRYAAKQASGDEPASEVAAEEQKATSNVTHPGAEESSKPGSASAVSPAAETSPAPTSSDEEPRDQSTASTSGKSVETQLDEEAQSRDKDIATEEKTTAS